MAKSVQQAEAELRTAAVGYGVAYKKYSEAFLRNGDGHRYNNLKADEAPAPLHPETEAPVKVVTAKSTVLDDAARALVDALAAEQRAEAM